MESVTGSLVLGEIHIPAKIVPTQKKKKKSTGGQLTRLIKCVLPTQEDILRHWLKVQSLKGSLPKHVRRLKPKTSKNKLVQPNVGKAGKATAKSISDNLVTLRFKKWGNPQILE